MRANIGFLLIGLGLVGAYIALGGKFSSSASSGGTSTSGGSTPNILTANQVGIANTGGTYPGGASTPLNGPFIPEPGSLFPGETPKDPLTNAPIGSGGMSIQSRLTQLGHIVSIQPMDRYASRGGF